MSKTTGRRAITDELLTAFEERFCHEYLIDLNATAAAVRAGSKATRPKEVGYQLLQKERVRARILQLMQERSQRTQIDADSVLLELAKIGFANMLDYVIVRKDGMAYVDLSRLTRDQAAAIQEVTVDVLAVEEEPGGDKVPVKRVKFKLSDKTRALELIGKHLGMFPTTIKGSIHHTHSFEQALEEVLGGDGDGGSDDEADDAFDPEAE